MHILIRVNNEQSYTYKTYMISLDDKLIVCIINYIRNVGVLYYK